MRQRRLSAAGARRGRVVAPTDGRYRGAWRGQAASMKSSAFMAQHSWWAAMAGSGGTDAMAAVASGRQRRRPRGAGSGDG